MTVIASASGWSEHSEASARRSRWGWRPWPEVWRTAPGWSPSCRCSHGLPLPEPRVISSSAATTSARLPSPNRPRNSGSAPASLTPGWLSACEDELAAATARVRPGSHFGAGQGHLRASANWGARQAACNRPARPSTASRPTWPRSPKAESLDHLIVLNVASTEPPFELAEVHQHWDSLNAALADGGPDLLPASALYALAAIERGHTYINFTPSLGASLPALHELADATGLAVRRQGRQDRRDPDEDGARPDVRRSAT